MTKHEPGCPRFLNELPPGMACTSDICLPTPQNEIQNPEIELIHKMASAINDAATNAYAAGVAYERARIVKLISAVEATDANRGVRTAMKELKDRLLI